MYICIYVYMYILYTYIYIYKKTHITHIIYLKPQIFIFFSKALSMYNQITNENNRETFRKPCSIGKHCKCKSHKVNVKSKV